MAVSQFSPALHAPAHPMANPGFGKRCAPDEEPRRKGDFAHLPKREAAIAAYIDRLPEGADISVKTLARELADYGQCAVGTALNRLSEAGHLRRVRQAVCEGEEVRWVFRTFFTRTPRADAWWNAYLCDHVPTSGYADAAAAPEPDVQGHDALARLGRREPRLALSAAECQALAPLAGEWFRRGATETQLALAITLLLPDPVKHPYGFVRSRLEAKLPPLPPPPVTGTYVMECTDCGAPGTPGSLPGGLCRVCRSEPRVPDRPEDGLPTEVVRGKAARLRDTVRAYRFRPPSQR
ncbi:hypothetical protein [Streptomyces flavidovirens]|uniref:hypothetical protein n=1 Tax=Streptomyces flavidovirens TaxID=67298 RepID=UPI00048D41F4|nr:hypothetical protein [Streptomyces flavidovirens]